VENTELLSEVPMIHLDHYSHENARGEENLSTIVKMPGWDQWEITVGSYTRGVERF
jgi:hypothetical protein